MKEINIVDPLLDKAPASSPVTVAKIGASGKYCICGSRRVAGASQLNVPLDFPVKLLIYRPPMGGDG